MNDKKFIDGLTFKEPREGAPSFVLFDGAINVAKLKAFLATEQGEWVNFQIKKSQKGSLYAEVNTWKKKDFGKDVDLSDIPV